MDLKVLIGNSLPRPTVGCEIVHQLKTPWEREADIALVSVGEAHHAPTKLVIVKLHLGQESFVEDLVDNEGLGIKGLTKYDQARWLPND